MGSKSKQDGQKKKKETPDRLTEAISKKIEEVQVGDRTLKVYKWNYWTSMRLAKTLTAIIQKALGSFKDVKDLRDILKTDFSELLHENQREIFELISVTITRDNFPTEEAAKEWAAEEVGLGEVVQLIYTIARQNLRPLVKIIKEVVAESAAVNAEARKALQTQTSSPNSSTEGTPTTE